MLEEYSKSDDVCIRKFVAKAPHCPASILKALTKDEHQDIVNYSKQNLRTNCI